MNIDLDNKKEKAASHSKPTKSQVRTELHYCLVTFFWLVEASLHRKVAECWTKFAWVSTKPVKEQVGKIKSERSYWKYCTVYSHLSEFIKQRSNSPHLGLAVNNHPPKSGDFRKTWLYNYILVPILGLFQIETIYLYYMLIK